MNSTNYLSPTFFLIGERKCGTSSLYRYLVQHPYILPCALKEPNFFGKGANYVDKHINDYWALFPKKDSSQDRSFTWPELNKEGILYEEEVIIPRIANQNYITGEASANTFFEVEPALVKKYLPHIKLILLFRNPIDRAFSQHRMYQRFQAEGRILKNQVHGFEEDISKEIAVIHAGGQGEFLSPSIYLPQLQKWQAMFGRSAIRLYFTEDLKIPAKAAAILSDLSEFLEIPPYHYGDYLKKQFNKAPAASIAPKLRLELQAFFKPYNQELFAYLKAIGLKGKFLAEEGRWKDL